MRVEQRLSTTFWLTRQGTPVNVVLVIQLTIPGDPGVSVSTELHFPKFLSEQRQHLFNQYMYEAVHTGIAATGLPLPAGGLTINILECAVSPSPHIRCDEEIARIGEPVSALVAGVIAGLLGSSVWLSSNT